MSESNGGSGRSPNLALQKERLRRGWTQQELADQVGTTVVNVSRWERGATSPNPYFRQRLCEVFEKDASELGLFSVRQASQSETAIIFEDITPDISEIELATNTHQSASLSLQQRFLGRRRTVMTLISSSIAALAIGGLFIYEHQQPLPPGTVIAKDTFQRPNQTYWGTTSDGHKWMEDANALTNFSISNHTAQIASHAGYTFFNAILEARASNAEVLFGGSMSGFRDSNLGAVLRWIDNDNWYKAFIDGTNLIIQKRVDGKPYELKNVPFPANAGTSYMIRFRVVGTNLSAKAWPTASSEPGNWTATVSDPSFSSGLCGLRIQVLYKATATVTSFLAMSV